MKRFMLLIPIIAFFSCSTPPANVADIGVFNQATDIGKVKIKGSTIYNPEMQTYTLTGSGANIWGTSDEFQFAHKKLGGDFIMTCMAHFKGEGVDPHRKMGLMFRSDLTGGSVYADAAIHGDGLTSLQYRPEANVETKEVKAELSAPDVIQLERQGDTIIMRAAKFGNPLQETGRVELQLPDTVYAGLFIGSHNPDVSETAVFENFRIDVPAADGVDGYQNLSPSRLEILDVETGHRKVIYTTNTHIEAPNWSPDGKFLLYNSDGKIIKFPLDTLNPQVLNTGVAQSCNNDHGISFDGTMLAVSSQTDLGDGKSGSIIYTIPIEGGDAFRVTDKAPSYWHGWSPDGKTLVYCAERNGNYDVYSIPATGGKEVRLTTAEGLDDGPEYSPDGKYIYFNSVRSGLMKIWRMKPDGSDQEQVSFGPYNDWFAHISPDGKRMVYVSYPPTVAPGNHPHNKRVMIQMQDTDSKESKVIAYLYGGQGTMNVPSWSPDGKRLAFVSFTYGDPEE
ncbi:TolB family protein [Prolixibacter denitrificans]|uniref:WD40 repeat protein n=1 Tax=Prolixibacter denitrificans TaxID=1541063 RepID=A0A2P8CAR3_9BACT|nr:TolB family protein [Prolixibacter denitrificans]PSK82012.1 WD40 repeat protein [Prolixibacter denitrificans]GET22607.1 hypothetical protein JCM18694_28530 [Prolixibacter denitrificans]